MLATTVPRQGDFLSLQSDPWQACHPSSTPSSLSKRYNLRFSGSVRRASTRDRQQQHTTRDVMLSEPARSTSAFTTLFSPQASSTPHSVASVSSSNHDGAPSKFTEYDSEGASARKHILASTRTNVTTSSLSSNPALISAPLQCEAIVRSSSRKVTPLHSPASRERFTPDAVSSSTRRGSAPVSAGSVSTDTASRKAHLADGHVSADRRRVRVHDDFADSEEGEIGDESDEDSDEGLDDEYEYDDYSRCHSHEDADVESDGDDDDDEHTQEELAELVDGPPSALPIPIPNAARSADDPDSVPVPTTPHFVCASPKSLPPLPISSFPLEERLSARTLQPSLSRRDSRRAEAARRPTQTATLPIRRRDRKYSISDPGHTTLSSSAPSAASLAALAHLSTMPFHSTSNRASWASSVSSTNPNLGYAYPTVETILDLGEGPSSMPASVGGREDLYMWAEPVRRRALFYGYDSQPGSANGSSVMSEGSSGTVRAGPDGGILFPRQASMNSMPMFMSMSSPHVSHTRDASRIHAMETANATRMSLAPSFFSVAASGAGEKRKRNKLRKLPPEVKAQLAAMREDDVEGLWIKRKGKGKGDRARRSSISVGEVVHAREREGRREQWRVPSYIVDERGLEEMGIRMSVEGYRHDTHREAFVDRRSWVEFGAGGEVMSGEGAKEIIPRAALLGRRRDEIEQERMRQDSDVDRTARSAELTLKLDTNVPKQRGRRMSVTFDEMSLAHTHSPEDVPAPGAKRSMSDDGHLYMGTTSGTHTPPIRRSATSRSVTSSSASRSGSSSVSASAASTAPTSPGVSEEGRYTTPVTTPEDKNGYFSGGEKDQDSRRASLAGPDHAHMSMSTSRVSLVRSIGGQGQGGGQRPRKLMKKRPGSVLSVSALSVPLPVSSAIGADELKKTVVSVEEQEAKDVDSGTEREGNPIRTRSILGIRLNSKTPKRKSLAVFDESESGGEPGEVRMLPPVRSSSPLWAGCSGTILSPYRQSTTVQSPSQTQSSAESPSQSASTTNALASLAFTGNSTLSSSALAALTSRLSQHEEANLIKDWHEVGREAFDPYAEQGTRRRSSTKSKETEGKGDEENEPQLPENLGATLARKAKQITRRSSLSLMRLEAHMHAAHASSDMASPKSPCPKSKSVPVSGTSTPAMGQGIPPVPRRSGSSTVSSPNAGATVPSTPTRPPMPRRRSKTISVGQCRSESLRRWTLAMADVPDEILVQELERIRLEGRGRRRRAASSQGHGTLEGTVERDRDAEAIVYGGPSANSMEAGVSHSGTGSTGSHGRRTYEDDAASVYSDDRSLDSHSPEHCEDDFVDAKGNPDPKDDAEWKSARRALLCCRELVRTERNYQARLRQLLDGDTAAPPSPFVLSYIPALLRGSEALLARLEDDPSAWGVSAAFLAVEEELEAAFVAWCGIVGEIFIGEEDGYEKDKSSRRLSMSLKSEEGNSTWGLRKRSRSGVSVVRLESVYRKRAVSYADPDDSEQQPGLGMFTAALGTGLAYGVSPPASTGRSEQSEDKQGRGRTAASASGPLLSRKFSTWRRMSMFSSSTSLLQSPSSPTSSHAHTSPSKEKKPTVRELAIQPTQRVMRYVLQYRDLLENTPMESPSRGLVEQALESATRIAGKCDRAQGNSAFLLRT